MGLRLYKATKLGEKTGGDISMPEDDEIKILRVVRESPATAEEVSLSTGLQKGKVSSILRKLCHKRLCQELTGNNGKNSFGGEL